MKELELYLKERKYRNLLEELKSLKFSIEFDKDLYEKKLKELKKLRKDLGYEKK